MNPAQVEYIAHISKSGKRTQKVAAHNDEVARQAQILGAAFGMGELAFCCGRYHDIGKNTMGFYKYLTDAAEGKPVVRGSVLHSIYGAHFASQLASPERLGKAADFPSRLAAEMIRISILSHHGLRDALTKDGISPYLRAKERILESYGDVERIVYGIYGEKDIAENFAQACEEAGIIRKGIEGFQPKANGLGSRDFYRALYVRLLTSILIDADRTCTACFEDNVQPPKPLTAAEKKAMWSRYRANCDAELKKLEAQKEPSPLDSFRREISEACANFDGGAGGIFRLVSSCGSGKTLSALRYALLTAERYGKSRIFYIAPYNSILDQNAGEIAKSIGDDSAVLRHHSNIVFDGDDEEQVGKYRLLTENWARPPIIATSAVQFLNTLFACGTSAVRRMQALGDAVIIVDEIQALPVKVLKPFNTAMNFLSTFCNSSILLCSATQPLLDELKEYRLLPPRDILQDADRYREAFRRVKIVDCVKGNGFSSEEAADFILEKARDVKSMLAVVNTKSAARRIARRIQEQTRESGEYLVFHLSTNMCPAHRSAIINEMRRCLSDKGNNKKIICVSTTLIEAGIDISFEQAVRSLAGLDSIIQVTGRCNRNGEADCGILWVIYINDENISMLGHLREAQEISREIFYNIHADPGRYSGGALSKTAMDEFYSKYYRTLQKEMAFPLKDDKEHTLIDLLTNNPTGSKRYKGAGSFLLKQAFREAGEVFEVIEDTGKQAVIVEYNDDARKHIKILLSSSSIEAKKRELRYLQRYTVELHPYAIERIGAGIHTEDENGVMLLSAAFYDENYGVDG